LTIGGLTNCSSSLFNFNITFEINNCDLEMVELLLAIEIV